MLGGINRILCVGAHQPPSNAYRRVLAFKRLRYVVDTVDVSSLTAYTRRLSFGMARPITRLFLLSALQAKVRSFQPDLVFFEKSLWLRKRDLDRLRQSAREPVVFAHYNPDDPFGKFGKVWGNFIGAIPAFDFHFVPKQENVAEYIGKGARHVYVFNRGFDPLLHRPVVLSPLDRAKYGCPVGFIGGCAPLREELIARLIGDGIQVAVWGYGWQRGRCWKRIQKHWRGPVQVGEDYTKAICGMDIALHFLRRENRDLQDSRTFEIPACGAFMLAERTSDHERIFRDGEEAVFFDDYDDLRDKVCRYLKDSHLRQRIAAAGRARCVQSGYDHDSRLRQFMDYICSTLKNDP